MAPTEADPPKTPATRPGGRSARVRRAVLDATSEQLMESGTDGLTLHAIAQRSGVHPTTLYRRWGTISALVVDAISELTVEHVVVPDRGSLQVELEAYFRAVTDGWKEPRYAALIRGLVSLPDQTTAGGREAYWKFRAEALGELIARGVERKELPEDVDVWTVFEQIAGPLWMRFLVTHRPINRPLVARLVTQAIATANSSATGAPRSKAAASS